MLYWTPLFHFYQPPTQAPGLTDWVRQTCYSPLLDLFLEHPEAHATLNIAGSLLIQLEILGAHDIFDKIQILLKRQQIELTSSPTYHPLIPLTDPAVITRQIDETAKVSTRLLKVSPGPGLFPPELAISPDSLSSLGSELKFLIIDESSLNPSFDLGVILTNSVFALDGRQLIVVSRSVSEILRSYPSTLTADNFTNFLTENTHDNDVVYSMSDAEVFGHHYSNRLAFLRSLLKGSKIKTITMSESLSLVSPKPIRIDQITSSSWQTSRSDLINSIPFPLWANPHNDLHKKYQILVDLAFTALTDASLTQTDNLCLIAQHHFDQGISSCHTFWLSRLPWWHPDLAEAGATELMRTIRTLPVSFEVKNKAETHYHSLLNSIWQFHWSGKIDEYNKTFDAQRADLLKGLPKII